MNNLFVSREMACVLGMHGFAEHCLAYYTDKNTFMLLDGSVHRHGVLYADLPKGYVLVPTYEQAFDYLRECKGLFCFITEGDVNGRYCYNLKNFKTGKTTKSLSFSSYNAAKIAAIGILIDYLNYY